MSKPTAIVVGVGAEFGLGAALSRRFAAEGYHVFVAGRTAGKIEQVVGTIRGRGGSAEPVVTDTTHEQDVVQLFDRAMSAGAGFEPVDLVAYNAGNNRKLDFRELSAETVRGLLAHRLLRRIPGRTRSRPPPRPAGARYRAVHRRFGEYARQAGLCAFRRRQSRPADDRSKHGSRVRPAGHSRRARSHRRRHRRRASASRASSNYERTRRGRTARHRGYRRHVLAHPSPAEVGMGAGSRSAPVQRAVLDTSKTPSPLTGEGGERVKQFANAALTPRPLPRRRSAALEPTREARERNPTARARRGPSRSAP